MTGFYPKQKFFRDWLRSLPFVLNTSLKDSFVFLFRVVNGSDDMEGLKNEIKDRFKDVILYVGSVLEFEHSKVFQIYTENIFIKFSSLALVQQINRFLTGNSLVVKRDLKISDHAFFVEAATSHGREIFNFCDELLSHPLVDFCHPELVTKLNDVNRSPEISSARNPIQDDRWWIKRVGLDKAHEMTKGEGALISVIDDGIEMLHPAFEGRIFNARDMVSEVKIGDASHEFNEFHGTSCSSVAASASELCPGVAPQARIMPIRITGLGSIMQSEAIVYAVNQGADVISCSWGPPDGNINLKGDDNMVFPLPDHTRLAFEYAAKHGRKGKGATIVFAGGNGNEPVANDGYASAKEVIAITSVNHKNLRSHYADFGYPVFCAFPSGDFTRDQKGRIIEATGLKTADRIGEFGLAPGLDFYDRFSGTSASCPGVAGVVALMYSLAPQLSDAEIRRIIKHSCEPVGDQDYTLHDGRSEEFGYGLLRADFALANTLNFIKNKSFTKPKPFIMDNRNEKLLERKRFSLHLGVNRVDGKHYEDVFAELYGCVNDTNSYYKLVSKGSFESSKVLLNEECTRDALEKELTRIAELAKEEDIVLITYAGHGSQVFDTNRDEEDDDKDETLVLFDGMWHDDETNYFISKFKAGVQILWISDSCHSGTNTRSILNTVANDEESEIFVRAIPFHASQMVYDRDKSEYEKRIARFGLTGDQLKNLEIRASVLTIAACQDHEYAQEKRKEGIFTKAFIQAVEDLGEDTALSNILPVITKHVNLNRDPSLSQNPLFKQYGGTPLVMTMTLKDILGIDTESGSQKDEKAYEKREEFDHEFIRTSNLLLVEKESNLLTKRTGSTINDRISRGGSVQWNGLNTGAGWDDAYKLMASSDDNQIEFIEPDISSNIDVNIQDKIDSRGKGEYLHTYPHPESNDPKRLTWHLHDNYTQLESAFQKACPESVINKPRKADEYPLIVHIDTGVISGHPSLPVHFDYDLSAEFTDPHDKNQSSLKGILEQQGHGHATSTLLAGSVYDMNLEEDETVAKQIGAFPYARVVSLKISDTVVLLRGKNFRKAVEYAIRIGADVISMSMAGAPSLTMKKAVNRAYEAGIVIVSAAGNSWSQGSKKVLPDSLMYPARFKRVIAATGITHSNEPYLVSANTRASGGLYMQGCFGPDKSMEYAMAAYTPNITWVDGNENDDFTRNGGGTSSATPQIAAAAALYLHHHRNYFAGVTQGWRKVETVRRALFESADKTISSFKYTGQGVLKAQHLLSIDPSKYETTLRKTKKDSLGLTGLDDLVRMWFSGSKRGSMEPESSTSSDREGKISEMLGAEIAQLMVVDKELSQFQDSEVLSDDMCRLILRSKDASNFLRDLVRMKINDRKSNDDTNSRGGLKTSFRPVARLDSGIAPIKLWANDEVVVNSLKKKEEDLDCEECIEIKMTSTTTRNSDDFKLAYSFDKSDENEILFITEYDDGTIDTEWNISEILLKEKNDASFRGNSFQDTPVLDFNEELVFLQSPTLTRKKKKKKNGIFRFIVKVYRVVRKIPLSGSRNIVFADLDSGSFSEGNWIQLDKYEKKEEILKQKKFVLLIHGTISQVAKSFEDLLKDPTFIQTVKQKYGRYILGFEMSTVRVGIADNSEKLIANLKKLNIEHSSLFVIGSSVGGLVAKKTFSLDVPIIFSASGHRGTPMVEDGKYTLFIEAITRIVLLTSGPIAPLPTAILQIIKFAIKGIFNAPGLSDQSPESKVLKELRDFGYKPHHLLAGSDFEPDNLINDSWDVLGFKNKRNDGIVPLASSLDLDDDDTDGFQPFHFFMNDAEIGHMSYFTNQHYRKTIIARL